MWTCSVHYAIVRDLLLKYYFEKPKSEQNEPLNNMSVTWRSIEYTWKNLSSFEAYAFANNDQSKPREFNQFHYPSNLQLGKKWCILDFFAFFCAKSHSTHSLNVAEANIEIILNDLNNIYLELPININHHFTKQFSIFLFEKCLKYYINANDKTSRIIYHNIFKLLKKSKSSLSIRVTQTQSRPLIYTPYPMTGVRLQITTNTLQIDQSFSFCFWYDTYLRTISSTKYIMILYTFNLMSLKYFRKTKKPKQGQKIKNRIKH